MPAQRAREQMTISFARWRRGRSRRHTDRSRSSRSFPANLQTHPRAGVAADLHLRREDVSGAGERVYGEDGRHVPAQPVEGDRGHSPGAHRWTFFCIWREKGSSGALTDSCGAGLSPQLPAHAGLRAHLHRRGSRGEPSTVRPAQPALHAHTRSRSRGSSARYGPEECAAISGRTRRLNEHRGGARRPARRKLTEHDGRVAAQRLDGR